MGPQITVEEYQALKAKDNPTAEDMELIFNAADHGFLPSEQNPAEEIPTQPIEPADDEQIADGGVVPSDTHITDDIPENPTIDDGTPEPTDPAVETERLIQAERNMRIAAERDAAARESALQEQIDLLKAQVTTGEETQSKVIDVEKALNPNPEDFDSEYDMMQYQLKQLIEIIKTQSVRDPRVDGVLSTLEDQKEKIKQREKEQLEEQNRLAFRNDIESFWKAHPEMRPSVGYDQAEILYTGFQKNLREKLNLDATETQKMIAQLHEPVMAKGTRALLESKGIEIPDDLSAIHNTLKVYDYQRGLKIDPATGKSVSIRGAQGQVQQFADLETAFFVMDKKNELVRKQVDIASATQRKIDMVHQSGNAIPTERLDRIAPDDIMSNERAAEILNDIKKNPRKYQTNPDLVKLKEQVYAKYDV